MGDIDPDQLPVILISTHLLGSVQDAHDLLIVHVIQQMNRIKPVNQSAGQQRRQEITEFTADYRIVIMLAGVIEFTGGLVKPHEDFNLPALGISLVRDLRIKIQVAFKDNRTEYLLLLAENLEFVIPGLLRIGKPVVFLFGSLPGIPERIQPFDTALVFGFLLLQ